MDELPVKYQDSCYNRNKTLIARYVDRILSDFPTPSERYYDIRLVSGIDRKSYFGEVGDQCIMFHSNRVCILTIAPTHPVIAEDKEITRIEHKFEGHEKIDRLSSQPQDGTKYVITAGISSKLIEINQSIVARPQLVKEKPLSRGFIAIIQPSDWKRMIEVRDGLPKLGQETELAATED